MSILGFLAGATNENSGPAAVLIVLLFVMRRFFVERKVNLNNLSGIMCSGLGFLTMIMSPGSQKRGSMGRSITSVMHNLTKIIHESNQRFITIYVLIILLIGILVITKRINRQNLTAVIIFLTGHFAAIYSMALSPDYPTRTFFVGVVFLGIALLILVYNLPLTVNRLYFPALVPLLIFFGNSYFAAYHNISMSHYEISQQYQAIAASKQNSPSIAHVKLLTPTDSEYNANTGTGPLAESPNDWINVWEAKYFGVDQIVGEK